MHIPEMIKTGKFVEDIQHHNLERGLLQRYCGCEQLPSIPPRLRGVRYQARGSVNPDSLLRLIGLDPGKSCKSNEDVCTLISQHV